MKYRKFASQISKKRGHFLYGMWTSTRGVRLMWTGGVKPDFRVDVINGWPICQ